MNKMKFPTNVPYLELPEVLLKKTDLLPSYEFADALLRACGLNYSFQKSGSSEKKKTIIKVTQTHKIVSECSGSGWYPSTEHVKVTPREFEVEAEFDCYPKDKLNFRLALASELNHNSLSSLALNKSGGDYFECSVYPFERVELCLHGYDGKHDLRWDKTFPKFPKNILDLWKNEAEQSGLLSWFKFSYRLYLDEEGLDNHQFSSQLERICSPLNEIGMITKIETKPSGRYLSIFPKSQERVDLKGEGDFTLSLKGEKEWEVEGSGLIDAGQLELYGWRLNQKNLLQLDQVTNAMKDFIKNLNQYREPVPFAYR